MISNQHKRIFGILFALVLLLLLSDIIIGKIFPALEEKSVISKAEADSVFIKTLMNFGFRPDWYFREGGKYSVSLPYDLPAELIMLDLYDYFNDKNFEIQSEEIVKGSRSLMRLYSGSDEILVSEFSYDKAKKRHTSEISFLLLNPDNLGESETSYLLNSQEKFSIALYPSKKNRVTADILNELGKQYVVIINNEIDELEYRLDDKFSDRKLLITIQSIISHFGKAVFYLIDNYDKRLSVRMVSILQKELDKRKIGHYYLQDYEIIRNITDAHQLEEVFNSSEDKNHIFLMDAWEYVKLKDELKYLRKRGFRIVPL